jgi:hypothetical protein
MDKPKKVMVIRSSKERGLHTVLIVAISMLILLAAVSMTSYSMSMPKSDSADYTEFYTLLDSCQEENSNINEKYNSLISDYNKLIINHSKSLEDYENLEYILNDLQSNYELILLNLTNLQNDYNTLQNSFNNCSNEPLNDELNDELSVLKTLRTPTLLAKYYRDFRSNLTKIGYSQSIDKNWWISSSYIEEGLEYSAKLASHDAGNFYWPFLDIESEYYDSTGEYSHQSSNSIMNEFLSFAKIDGNDTSTEKVDKIMNHISHYIHYENKTMNAIWFPVESLSFMRADQINMAILYSAIFEMVEIKSAIGFFGNSTGAFHMIVLIQLDDLEGYEYMFYDDLVNLGLSPGRWIIIDPLFDSLSEQELNLAWLDQWHIGFVAELPIRV